MILEKFGWNYTFEKQIEKNLKLTPGRITCQQKNHYTVVGASGEKEARVSGNFRFNADGRDAYPSIGDWVLIDEADSNMAIIDSIIPRKNCISRNTAGGSNRSSGGPISQQVIAANVDIVLIVTGLDRDFNLRRIERYLSLTYSSGATPIIILNKMDLCDDPEGRVRETEGVAFGVPVHAVSAHDKNSIKIISGYLKPGSTSVLVGSSGAGKSTIINTLFDSDKQKVHEISKTVNKGMHTTTHRELFILPGGGIIIDNPGMREIQLFDDDEGVETVFSDIEKMMLSCRFSDCSHQSEPGCTIKKAIKTGDLSQDRYNSYLKLKRENRFLQERKNKSARALEKEKWKPIFKQQRELYKSGLKYK